MNLLLVECLDKISNKEGAVCWGDRGRFMWSLSPRIKTYTRFSLSPLSLSSEFSHEKKPSETQARATISDRECGFLTFRLTRSENVEPKDWSLIHNKTAGSRTKSGVHFVESIRDCHAPLCWPFPLFFRKALFRPLIETIPQSTQTNVLSLLFLSFCACSCWKWRRNELKSTRGIATLPRTLCSFVISNCPAPRSLLSCIPAPLFAFANISSPIQAREWGWEGSVINLCAKKWLTQLHSMEITL